MSMSAHFSNTNVSKDINHSISQSINQSINIKAKINAIAILCQMKESKSEVHLISVSSFISVFR